MIVVQPPSISAVVVTRYPYSHKYSHLLGHVITLMNWDGAHINIQQMTTKANV